MSNKPNISTKQPSLYEFTESSKREKATKLNYAKIQEILQRNVKNTASKTFTQYTKELLKTYIQSPLNNQDTIREVSRFLERHSMIYKKIIMYYASMPMFYYNITQINDFTKNINTNKSLKAYEAVLKKFETFKIRKEGYNALYQAIRDGWYVGFTYNSEEDGSFCMPLDVQYCRIYGKTTEGEWIVYFNAAYFDSGTNKDYVSGIDGVGQWDECFVDGYNQYKNGGRDYQWFRLPPEKTFTLLTCPDDEFAYPLPFFLPLFIPLLDLLDLEQIVADKNELENYKLIINKIPLVKDSDDVDDFALSLEIARYFNELMENIVPELVGVVMSPMEKTDVVSFENSNSSKDTDMVNNSVENLFLNAGASKLVVSSGTSTNSVGLKYSILNDISNVWVWVDRIESWLNYYIKKNIGEDYILQIHKVAWYNLEEYQASCKDRVSFGSGIMDWLTCNGDTPYMAYQKLRFESVIGIRDLIIPLQSAYTSNINKGNVGRPQSNETELSESGLKTRDGNKNAGTKANG